MVLLCRGVTMLSVRNLTKIYKLKGKGAKQVVALDHVSLDFPETGMIFLLGKSGSGKSTLLNTIGGLDKFDEGEVIIKGKSSKQFKQSDFDAYRNTFIGFIFQEYNILEEFSVGKNLALALELQGKRADRDAVEALLEKVDLSGYYKRNPNQLSGGQKQRVAIARALIKDPEIIMADEPTGALDSTTGKQVMDTLKKLSSEKLVIVVSHDREFAEIYGDRVIELKDGKIIRDVTKTEVEAEKSSTGVSFIDDKIIHIRKGQKLNQDDLTRINRMIISNLNNEDTIISFDKGPNTQIKKTAFITDEGNREVFKDTTEEDLNLLTYDPKQFKLIHSKMKKKDAFKMGSSSLKHKPIRLFFTILLSFIAFAMFGLTDTMASYNVATSTYESMKQSNVKTIAISGATINDNGYKYPSSLTFKQANDLATENPDYEFFNVLSRGNYYINGLNSKASSGSNPLYYSYSSGMLPLNEDIASKLNLTLVEGHYPTGENEIVISKHIFDVIKRNYEKQGTFENAEDKKITSFADLSTVKFNQYNYGSGSSREFVIVGVVADDTDISKYEKKSNTTITSEEDAMRNISEMMYSSEIYTIAQYGLLNMSYISETLYNNLLAQNTVNKNYNYYIGTKPKNSYSSISVSSFYNFDTHLQNFEKGRKYKYYNEWTSEWQTTYLSQNHEPGPEYIKVTYAEEYIQYSKSGYDFTTLGENDIIIPEYTFTNKYGSDLTDSEIMSILNNGLTFTLADQDNVVKTFNVVGIGTNSLYNNIISSNAFVDLFGGVDYVITRAKNSGSDSELVKKLITTNDSGLGFEIEFAATSMLSSFGNTIVSMSQVFLYIGIGFAIFASFMLMNFISTSIAYKKREIGVLRAIGAGKKDVFSIFFSESLVIALINFVLATITTFIVAYLLNRGLYVDLGFTITLLTVGVRQILLLLGVSVGVAFISTLLPVWKIARKNPIDSINNR